MIHTWLGLTTVLLIPVTSHRYRHVCPEGYTRYVAAVSSLLDMTVRVIPGVISSGITSVQQLRASQHVYGPHV